MIFLCQKRPVLSQAVKLEENTQSFVDAINLAYNRAVSITDLDVGMSFERDYKEKE